MKNKKFLILLTTTALIIAGCVLGVYLLNKPEKKSVAKNTTKKTEQPDKNKSRNSDTTDSENTSDKTDSSATKSMTMAEFKKKYPVGTKVKCTDGTYTIDDYDNGEVYYYAPDGTYCFSKGPLDFSNEKTDEQKQAEKDYKAGKYPTDDYYQQRAMDKYREVTKAYIDGKIDRVPRRADYDNGGPTGVDTDNIIIRYTTKGYACIVFEGYVIYEEMLFPNGYAEFTDGVHTCTAQALMKWCDDRGIEDYYSLSYKQLQQIFGKLDKNSKSLTYKEWSKSNR